MVEKKKNGLPEELAALRKKELPKSAFAIRITEHKGVPTPYMEIKTRQWQSKAALETTEQHDEENAKPAKPRELRACGCAYGTKLIQILPVVRKILEGMKTLDDELPMGVEKIIEKGKLVIDSGTLPLSEESGVKLALIFKLQESIKDNDRVELIARRVAQFSREEALYWYSRASGTDKIQNNWALAGMRTMLSGSYKTKEKEIQKALEALRNA